MKNILTIILAVCSFIASAQECTTEMLLQKAGPWKESTAGIKNIAVAEQAKAKKTIAAIHTMIKSKYKPTGVEALVNSGYNQAMQGVPVNNYIYSILPMNYYCDGNAVKVVHETSTYFQIAVNYFFAEIHDTAEGDRALLEGFHVINKMPKAKDGYYYFDEEKTNLGLGIMGTTRSWLVTYDGKLPWAYVTKKEFLEKRKRILLAQKETEASGFKDVLKNNEISKTYKEKEYKNDAEKMARFTRMDYEPTKERYNKMLTDIDKQYEAAFKKIDDQLKGAAAELNEFAIVKMDPKDHLSYVFVDGDDKMGKVLIRPNPSYFKKVPRSTPQFFCITVTGDPKEPIANQAMEGLMKAVDFVGLKAMLGK